MGTGGSIRCTMAASASASLVSIFGGFAYRWDFATELACHTMTRRAHVATVTWGPFSARPRQSKWPQLFYLPLQQPACLLLSRRDPMKLPGQQW